MALGKSLDLTSEYKANVYSITLDMSGWDKTTFHVLAPVAAPIFVYDSNDAGAGFGITDGNASLATNFATIQTTPLANNTPATSISTAGAYKVDVNTQFIRLQGGGADVYRLYAFHSKIS